MSDNRVMSNNLVGDSFMVLELEHETPFTQTLEPPTLEESPRLSEEEAEAFLDAYSAAVVTVAERVSPAVVNIAMQKDVTAQGPNGQRVYTVPGGGSGVHHCSRWLHPLQQPRRSRRQEPGSDARRRADGAGAGDRR